jgi:hypothetical protein
MFPEIEASGRRVDDSVSAVGWLLGKNKEEEVKDG